MRSYSRAKLAALVAAVAAAGGWLIATQAAATGVRNEAAELAAVLGLDQDSRIADIGAGKGALSIELARHVVPAGHVFATEIDGDRRRQIQSAADEAVLSHVSVVGATETDTGLQPDCCDAIFLRTVYHHVTRPAETNTSLHDALRSGGRLAVIDFPSRWFLSTFFRVKGVPANRGGHGVPPDVVIEEFRSAGFILERRIDQWRGGM